MNRSQSSNDVFPTAMSIAAADARSERDLIPAVQRVHDAIAAKAKQFAGVVKIGRTHLQDAVPLTVGQEMSGWASLLGARRRSTARWRWTGSSTSRSAGRRLAPVSTPRRSSRARAAAKIAELTGTAVPAAPQQVRRPVRALTSWSSPSGAVATLAGSLMKIANDIRLLASGPRAGLGELILPANEPGSSIMPGKVNPTQCEAMTMVGRAGLGHHDGHRLGRIAGATRAEHLPARHDLRLPPLGAVCSWTPAGRFVDHMLVGLEHRAGADRRPRAELAHADHRADAPPWL